MKSPDHNTCILHLIVASVATIACIIFLIPASNPRQYNLLRLEPGTGGRQNRQLLSLPDPKTVELRVPPMASDIPNYDYTYLIIHYHKSGHNLAYSITKIMRRIMRNDARTNFKTAHNPLPIREHDKTTKCPHMDLLPGVVWVQVGLDFFCDINILAQELLYREKSKGIKIIHLVRNPFDLAVSNYKYHSQHPTPEKWVKKIDVCKDEETGIYPDLLMPTLGKAGVMEYEDFNSILDLCHSLVRTKKRHPRFFKKSTYYSHLRALDPVEGLQLATTHMMRGRLGDIPRMANNIIKLHELQQLENLHSNSSSIEILTFAMEEFTQRPEETTMRFVEFLLRNSTSSEVKEHIVTEYAQTYLNLVNGGHSNHITTGQGIDSATLKTYLREHELFGGILSNIESLVDDAIGGGVGVDESF